VEEVQLLPADKLAWHEEQAAIPLSPGEAYARLNGAPLEGLLPGTSRIPAVVGTTALEYGKGEFWYQPAEHGQATTLRWRYSFKLRSDRFPGALGPFGRFLFTKAFLDRSYATFMKSAMNAIDMNAIERYALQPRQAPARPG
jgi:hypothetical protein